MRANFVVSDYRRIWLEGAKRLYTVEPYVRYRLERTGNIGDYEEIVVAPFRRQTSADLQKDHDLVQLKFDKYIDILSWRLNKAHGTDYSAAFWRRALSLSFERHITFCYEMFANCEAYFDPVKHDCRVLSKSSYRVPADFDEQRIFFQHSDFGQEQLFSIYMHVFHPAVLKTLDARFERNSEREPEKPKKSLLSKVLEQGFSKATFEKVLTKVLERYYAGSVHKLGFMGSFFSAKNQNLLMLRSKGAIYPLKWGTESGGEGQPLYAEAREALALVQDGLDRFDRYFFASLEHCLPRIFVEDFKKVERHYSDYFQGFKDLEYVTSEGWLSSSSLSIALALLKERGVKHIYNEHNYYEHPWVGSMIPKEASLADIFISMGWENGKIPNLIKGASLFDFKLEGKPEKIHKICFIGSGASAKRPNYTASYGWACENAPKYFDFVRRFFEGLTEAARGEMIYRGYPLVNFENWLAYDQDFMLEPYLKQLQRHTDRSVPGKLLMLQSELVVIDYISTSYIESMTMDIPTVFFWNPEAYYLGADYADFFAPLVSAGICQTDPAAAARFVESIKDEPQKWWRQEAVQKAKDEFLRKNVGNPEVLVDLLLAYSGTKGKPPSFQGGKDGR